MSDLPRDMNESYVLGKLLPALRLHKPPFWMVATILAMTVASWIPLVVIWKARYSTNTEPRIHIFQDMDNQAKYKPQKVAAMFADQRAERPIIEGTVARGKLYGQDDHYLRGYETRAGANGGQGEFAFFSGFPKQITLSEQFLKRGQEKFIIYCSPCHGADGQGNGIVHLRATELAASDKLLNPPGVGWAPPNNLTDDVRRSRSEGHLFNTITNGIRNMAGYGGQLSVDDRWAVVAYLRALQFSQGAPASVLSEEQRQRLPAR